jgi:hypothetical protein
MKKKVDWRTLFIQNKNTGEVKRVTSTEAVKMTTTQIPEIVDTLNKRGQWEDRNWLIVPVYAVSCFCYRDKNRCWIHRIP